MTLFSSRTHQKFTDWILDIYRGADKSLARPDWKNNWKVATFHPTRRSLLPWRPGWTDNLLNFFFWGGGGSGLQKLEFGHCSLFPSWLGWGLISTPVYNVLYYLLIEIKAVDFSKLLVPTYKLVSLITHKATFLSNSNVSSSFNSYLSWAHPPFWGETWNWRSWLKM